MVYLTAGAACRHGHFTLAAITRSGRRSYRHRPLLPRIQGVDGERPAARWWKCPPKRPSFQPDVPALARGHHGRRPAPSSSTPRTTPWAAVYTRAHLGGARSDMLAREGAGAGPAEHVRDQRTSPTARSSTGKDVPVRARASTRDTIVCYSYSASPFRCRASVSATSTCPTWPGRRARGVHRRRQAQVARLGFICAPVLFQRVIARCIEEPSDVAAYAENRRVLLTEGSGQAGLRVRGTRRCVLPVGACARGRRPGVFRPREGRTSFCWCHPTASAWSGWVRVSYCIPARDHRAQHAGVQGAHARVSRIKAHGPKRSAAGKARCSRGEACWPHAVREASPLAQAHAGNTRRFRGAKGSLSKPTGGFARDCRLENAPRFLWRTFGATIGIEARRGARASRLPAFLLPTASTSCARTNRPSSINYP